MKTFTDPLQSVQGEQEMKIADAVKENAHVIGKTKNRDSSIIPVMADREM